MITDKKKRPIFFDIEAGGLSGQRNSIYSISYSQGKKTRSYFANPVPGTRISRWSRENVWEPIKKQASFIGSEKRALNKFLNVLEKNKGGTLAGWNIGYMPTVQAQEYGVGATGFDIPMIMTRAGKYGLRERYQQAFRNMNVRDVGVEYSVRLAQGLQKYPHLIEKNLFEQVVGYNKQIDRFVASNPRASIPEIARHMSTSGYRLSGWKQETTYGLMFPGKGYAAHQSEADIGAVRELARAGKNFNVTPEFASQWNREALSNSLVNQLVKPSNRTPYTEAQARAAQWGIGEKFESELAARVKGLGGNLDDVRAGRGVSEITEVVRGSRIASAVEGLKTLFSRGGGGNLAGVPGALSGVGGILDNAIEFGKGHKGKLIAGGVLLGLYATKPGSLFNSDKVSYSGEVKKSRGDTLHERQIRRSFDVLTENLDKYGTKAGTAHNRLLVPKEKLGSAEDLEKVLGFVPVSIAIPEAGQDTVTSWRHPTMNYHIHSHGKNWTIHEDEHAALTMQWANPNNNDSSLSKFVGGVSHILAEGVPGAYYYAKGQLTGAEDMDDRLRREMDPGYKKLLSRMPNIANKGWLSKIKKAFSFSGSDDEYNEIEGLRHGGVAQQKRREMTDFGSGWVRKALSKGIDAARIASAASKLGTGIYEGSRLQFGTEILKGLRGNVDDAVKLMRSSQGVTINGERYILGKEFASGGFGRVYKAHGLKTNRTGAYKVLKGETILQPGQEFRGPAVNTSFKQLGKNDPRLSAYTAEYSQQMMATGEKYGLAPGSLAYEAKMQELARQQMGDVIPEVYGLTDKGLMTEFAGSGITGGKYKNSALDWIEQRWGNDLTSSGDRVRHFDPQTKNMVRRGGKYRIIDFGVSAEGPSLSRQSQDTAEEVLGRYSQAERYTVAKRQRFIQGHQQGVKLAAEQALRPGSRHTKQTGKMVAKPDGTLLLR